MHEKIQEAGTRQIPTTERTSILIHLTRSQQSGPLTHIVWPQNYLAQNLFRGNGRRDRHAVVTICRTMHAVVLYVMNQKERS